MNKKKTDNTKDYLAMTVHELTCELEKASSKTSKEKLFLAQKARINEFKALLWKTAASSDLSPLKLVEHLFQLTCNELDLCKISYLEYLPFENIFKSTVRWLHPGCKVESPAPVPFELAVKYLNKPIVELPSEALPEDLEAVENLLDQAKEKTVLYAPFPFEAGTVRRAISFSSIRQKRVWSETEKDFLRELIGSLSSRIKIEKPGLDLEVQSRKFQAYVENSNNIIYSLSPDGKITYISPSVRDILGYKTEEVIGQSYTLFTHPNDIAVSWQKLKDTIQNKTKISDETIRFKAKNGDWRWFATNFSTYQDEFEKTPYFLGVAFDITDRIISERLLRQERERFQKLVENTPTIIAEISKEGIIQYVNQRALQESGYKREELVGHYFLEAKMFRADQHTSIMEAFQGLVDGKEVHGFEIVFLTKDEEELHLETHAIPLENNILVVLVNITEMKLASMKLKRSHDELELRVEKRTQQLRIKNEELNSEVAERKKIEEELRDSQQKLHLVIDTIPQYIFWKDRNSIYQWCNQNFATASGIGLKENIVGKTDHDLDWTKEQAEFHIESDKRIMDTDTPEYHIIEEQTHRDGQKIWISLNKIPLHDAKGKVIGILGTYEDITDELANRKREKFREQQLVQADKMISLGILVSGIAHEINNPNQFIMSHIAPLKRTFDGLIPILDQYCMEFGDFKVARIKYSALKKQLPTIFNNLISGSQRIKNIVAELREYIAEYPSEHTETIQFNSVVESALTLLENLIKKSTSQFQVIYGEDLPFLIGHYQRLEQVIINLVQNACQSLTCTKEKITVQTDFDTDENAITFTVTDEGIGIPDEHLERVTDLFFTTKRDIGGVGLGLAISSRIIMEHEGKLIFTRGEKKGTVAQITLPLEREGTPAKPTDFSQILFAENTYNQS